MSPTIVKLQIPFESLVDAISSLSLEEKRELWQRLEREITEADKEFLEEDIYDWGVEGQPKTKPVEYIPEVGLVVIGDRGESE